MKFEMARNHTNKQFSLDEVVLKDAIDYCCTICRQQTGTIRTNCLDCLDRTNAVQNMVALEVILLISSYFCMFHFLTLNLYVTVLVNSLLEIVFVKFQVFDQCNTNKLKTSV